MAILPSANQGLRELALFAGAGGGILGGHLLGWRTVCAVERDVHSAQILAQRQNDKIFEPFPIWSDVRSFDGRPWKGIVDVVSGGFPCQDISSAGKGAGIYGPKSSLWKDMARIISEVQPEFAFVENSPALTSRGLGVVLGDLATMGFDARWGVLRASESGLRHSRARIWIVASHPKWSKRRNEPLYGANRRMGRLEQPFAWDGNWLDVFAGVRGNGNGLAHRLDRTDAIRNGQVPRVAARAFQMLSDIS